jgi:PAS domain S-box-containing protein
MAVHPDKGSLMKVLIAEDDVVTGKMLEGLLTSWGYRTVTAIDGTEAWRILQEQEAPTLAILDWSMPGLDGLQICRQLRRQLTPTPTYVILLTAHASKVDVVAGLEAGANDYIAKPFDPDELRARVNVGRTVTALQHNVAQRMREFQDYVEDAPLGILVVEHNGVISFANGRACSIFGYDPDELVGKPVEILVPLPMQQLHVELRNRYFQCPHGVVMAGRELVGRRKDNSSVPVAIGLNALRCQTPPRVVSTVMDLTDLRRAEEELESFFELSLDLFCIAHVNGSLRRMNANYRQLLGYSTEELLARPFFDHIHPEDLPSVRVQVQRLAEGEAVIDFRCRLRDSSGKDYWTEWNARSVLERGTIYAVGRNITERLRIEKELLYRVRRERAILDNTPAVIYVRGADGRYEFVNRRHAELFSGDQESAVGKRTRDFFTDAVADRLDGQDRQVLETGETISVEETDRRDDGVHTYASVKFPLLDPGGRVCATAGIATDITEQLRHRQTERELVLAHSFQNKLYPRTAPAVRGIGVAGSAFPVAQMCGDYYDYVLLGPGRLLITLGDVSGHGVGPALQMMEVRSTVRTLARLVDDLPSLMADLNRSLCEDLPESTFISFFLADIDLEKRRIRHVGAGHDAFLIRADATVVRLESTHPLLGIDSSVSFVDVASTDIGQGDVLFIFTDGLSDARSARDEEFGRQRPINIVACHHGETADRILGELFQSVLEFTSGCTIRDDITAVIAKIIE